MIGAELTGEVGEVKSSKLDDFLACVLDCCAVDGGKDLEGTGYVSVVLGISHLHSQSQVWSRSFHAPVKELRIRSAGELVVP